MDSVDSSQLHADWINITKIRIICLLIKLTAVFQVATGNSFLFKRMRTVEKGRMDDGFMIFIFILRLICNRVSFVELERPTDRTYTDIL